MLCLRDERRLVADEDDRLALGGVKQSGDQT
jgi:hypothetical protein